MLKFKYNYSLNSLQIHKENDIWYEIPEEQTFTGNFESQGFKLDNGWISFTVWENKIRVFYKELETPSWINYYQKDLPKECPVIFTFTELDEVEKVNGKWRKKTC